MLTPSISIYTSYFPFISRLCPTLISLFSIIFWRAFYFIVLRPSRIHCRLHSSFQVQQRRPLAKFDVSLVKDSLRRNVFFWHAIRVPEFTLSVIQESYRLLFGTIPFRNVLKNNMISSKIRRGSRYVQSSCIPIGQSEVQAPPYVVNPSGVRSTQGEEEILIRLKVR